MLLLYWLATLLHHVHALVKATPLPTVTSSDGMMILHGWGDARDAAGDTVYIAQGQTDASDHTFLIELDAVPVTRNGQASQTTLIAEIELSPTRIVIAEQDESLQKVLDGVVCDLDGSVAACVEAEFAKDGSLLTSSKFTLTGQSGAAYTAQPLSAIRQELASRFTASA